MQKLKNNDVQQKGRLRVVKRSYNDLKAYLNTHIQT